MSEEKIITIYCGNNRQTKVWKKQEITLQELYEKLKTPIRTTETAEEYKKMKKSDRDAAKDHGGFVGGVLKDGSRKRENTGSRELVTLDVDHAATSFLENYKISHYKSILYTTHSHTPESPRFRVIIPLTHPVSVDTYNAISRLLAGEIGIEQVDPCSFLPHQLMYWPSAPIDGEYICEMFEGEELDPDTFLEKYPDWKDPTKLPKAKNEKEAGKKEGSKVADPLTKKGIRGVFNRTYTIQAAIEKYLPHIYSPTQDPKRYQYIPSDSIPGLMVFEDKFAYSHHASDPAYGQELSAFDLVRIHLFEGDYKQMAEMAMNDEEVKVNLVDERRQEAQEDFKEEKWEKKLAFNSYGEIDNTVPNLMLILTNDPRFKGFAFNEMANKVEVTGEVPWDRPKDNRFWRDADTAQLKTILDTDYRDFTNRNFDICFTKVTDDRRYHPIKEYLSGLPVWDGIERVDTLFIDYFGAEDNVYIREASRKSLVAAIARVFHPGTKFDYVPVLNGPQGIGKSTFFDKLAKDYFSDSLTLTDMKDKSGAEKLQGYWILEMSELSGMRKADQETVKSFLSRRDDDYRPSYGRTVESHPRQCIIVGSTNAQSGFLRDITGNRRFWPICVTGESRKKSWELTDEEVDQIWAEALEYYKGGESLKLSVESDVIAFGEQTRAMEKDERQGLVEEYLNTLLPDNWDGMDLYARRNFLTDKIGAVGTVERKAVSNAEIWCECYGKNLSEMKASDSYAIASLMVQIDGWNRSNKTRRLPMYGKQRLYIKEE